MTALLLCGAIVHSLRDHPEVTGVVPVGTVLLESRPIRATLMA